MPPISISIYLDPNRSITEVQEFVLNNAFGGRFKPLYRWDPRKISPNFEFVEQNDHLKCSVYKTNSLDIPAITFGSSKESSLGGYFLLRAFHSDSKFPIVHFMLPEIKTEKDRLALKWSELEPSLKVQVVYYEYEEKKTLYVNIEASQGLWGTRHQWFDAMCSVLKEQAASELLKADWESDASLIETLENQAKEFSDIELKNYNFKDAREIVWDAARKIKEKFSINDNSSYVSPELNRETNRPADVLVFKLGKFPAHPIQISDEAWTALAWHECFSWGSPELLTNRTISYWANYKDERKFLKLIKYPKIGWKGTWPAIVETITKRPETPEMIHELLGFVADPNWPGSDIAFNHLYKMGSRAIPFIDEGILEAKRINDDGWAAVLLDIKDGIMGNEKTDEN